MLQQHQQRSPTLFFLILLQQLLSLTFSSPATTTCSLCHDGQPPPGADVFPDLPNLDAVAPTLSCTQLDMLARQQTDRCEDWLALGLRYCHCPVPRARKACSVCAGGNHLLSSQQMERELPLGITAMTFDAPTTCGDLVVAAGLMQTPDDSSSGLVAHDDICASVHMIGLKECGCPISCSLCADGSTVPNPNQELVELPVQLGHADNKQHLTCGDLQAIAAIYDARMSELTCSDFEKLGEQCGCGKADENITGTIEKPVQNKKTQVRSRQKSTTTAAVPNQKKMARMRRSNNSEPVATYSDKQKATVAIPSTGVLVSSLKGLVVTFIAFMVLHL